MCCTTNSGIPGKEEKGKRKCQETLEFLSSLMKVVGSYNSTEFSVTLVNFSQKHG